MDSAEIRRLVYEAARLIKKARPEKRKHDILLPSELADVSALETKDVTNALKWLRSKGLAYKPSADQNGWLVREMSQEKLTGFCWKHGLAETRGNGWFCPVCKKTRKE